MDILVYICPFPSQAIFQGDLRIVRMGGEFLCRSGPSDASCSQAESVIRNDGKQRTLPADTWTGSKTMKVQIAACLLCLIIVGGSLDSLLDSPAMTPRRNQNNLVSRLDYHVPVAAKQYVLDCLARAAQFQAGLFSFDQIFESGGPSCKLTLVRQATDTSPPCFS